MEHGTFCWNELITDDPEKSGAFFVGLLGWGQKKMETQMGTYTVFTKDGKEVGGMMKLPAPEGCGCGCESFPPGWYAYIAVEDVDASAAKASELGGNVLMPPFDIPDVGRICAIADPTGNCVMLMTPAAK